MEGFSIIIEKEWEQCYKVTRENQMAPKGPFGFLNDKKYYKFTIARSPNIPIPKLGRKIEGMSQKRFGLIFLKIVP